MSEARKHLETEVKAAKYLGESTVAVSVDHLNTLLKASPPSGGEVYQLLSDDGTWTDTAKEVYDIPSEAKRRILYTSPRVVDGVVLSREHVKFIADILENYDDCGPSGEGWQSQAMTEINKALQAALEAK